jgi:cytochrome c biogenesis protein CcdA
MLENLFSPLNTFLYGLGLGGVFLVLALWSHWKTKREFKRFKSHLSDKLDVVGCEHDSMAPRSEYAQSLYEA